MSLLDLRVPLTGPHVKGDLPGPRSAELLARQRRRESNARTYPRHLPFAPAEASGSFVRDVDGNVFIDFLAGAGVLSLGHSHPELVRVAAEQLERHTHGLDFPTPAKDDFVDAQLSMLPQGLRDRMKLHFCGPAGANAVDAAIKLCKTATGRGDVISFQGGFHGSSHAAMAVTGLVDQKRPVPNGVPGIHFFPYSYCGRCALALTPDTCAVNCIAYLERSLQDPNGGVPLPAAVILEPVQGEGGVVPARREFVQRARALTRELGIPLIVDEVQSGCGRTGTWFAFEQYDIEPDVIVASKALSGIGTPVAIIIYDERLDVWAPAPTPAPSGATSWPSPPGPRRSGSSAATTCSATLAGAAGRSPTGCRGCGPTRGCARSAGSGSCGASSWPTPGPAGRPASWPAPSRPGPCARASSWSSAAATTASCGCCPH